MTRRREPTRATAVTRPSTFERILVGVDGTRESLDACRQVEVLAEPQATIAVATVSLFPPGTAAAADVDDLAEQLDRTANSALSAAGQILGAHADLRRLHGLTVDALLAEVTRMQATLLAFGTHGHRRIEEIVLGGVAGELVHKAPCSVLVARSAPDPDAFPREIVVGIDGSDEAERAFDVARRLAKRHHSTLRTVVAHGGKRVNLGEIANRHPRIEASAEGPVPALAGAASSADLLVVGSRGLHGPRALGSVSERVAHEASCSVLVVR
jgi:nucleotide-binding universal stress UspA family protein